MELRGNTIFITGGGTGIGRGYAELFHARGNQVIIAGRRRAVLDKVCAANPGMAAIELDIADRDSISRAATELTDRFPELNMLMNNAGIMLVDDAGGQTDDAIFTRIIETNVLGTMRVSAALTGHLKGKPQATIFNVTSMTAFLPLTRAACYSASKAALHSYCMSQRHQLRDHGVRVVEIVPPRVEVHADVPRDPMMMTVKDFIAATLPQIEGDADEAVIDRVQQMRCNPGPDEYAFVAQLNDRLGEIIID